MEKSFDLYGFKNIGLEKARELIEQTLGISFIARDSLYHGGDYYDYGDMETESFVLKRNIDLLDDEPLESEFSDIKILFYVENTSRSEEIEKRLLNNVEDISLLKREKV